MKIAFNIDYSAPSRTGIGRYGVELMKALIGLRTPCEVWMTRYMRDFPEISPAVSERTIYYPWPRRLTDYLWPSLRASKENIKWVHSANCTLLPRGLSFRQVTMIHDMGPFNYGHMKVAKNTSLWRKRIRNVVRNADCIVVNSKATGNDLIEHFPETEDRVFLTPLGIDHFSTTPRRKKTPGDHILTVGTVEPRKNIDNLIKAYAILAQKKNFPSLVIAGMDGFKADEYKKLPGELGISQKVRFTGYLSDSDLLDLYSRAICLVHPAHHEGFGFTVPEAFTWDLPVAASCTGGLGEFFGQCVWPIDPSSIESIASAITNALEQGVTAKQEDARRMAVSQLTWKNCAEATLTALCSAGETLSSR